MPNAEIEKLSAAIEVPFLLHFTRSTNLQSIMQHGIHPVQNLAQKGIKAEINDHLRLDGNLNGTSTSIAFPNASMFFKLRNENPDVDWTILAISKKVLWEKDVLFCRHNAADNRVSGMPKNDLQTSAAFLQLFDEIEDHASRADQGLKPFDPTDVQAEVMVMDSIEPTNILGAVFISAESQKAYGAALGARKIVIHPKDKGFFANRSYHRKWGGG